MQRFVVLSHAEQQPMPFNCPPRTTQLVLLLKLHSLRVNVRWQLPSNGRVRQGLTWWDCYLQPLPLRRQQLQPALPRLPAAARLPVVRG